MAALETIRAPLVITLFGPMQTLVNSQPLPRMRSRKGLWLLALLTLHHDRSVEREWLAGTLWPDVDQSQAFASLRPVLSVLRKALGSQGERLKSPDRHTLCLDLAGTDVDLLTFDAAIAGGQLPDLEQAVTLYRGPLVEGCTQEWALQERTAREQDCLQALHTLGAAAQIGGEYEKAARYYQRAVGMDPWGESARRGWMEALAKSGDRNAALKVYREFVDFLRTDPNAAPDEQTSALYMRLRAEARERRHAHSVETVAEPAAPMVTGSLPHPLTELVGRTDERMEVALRLRRSRLVTLTGMGGIGKTRLALEVARESAQDYAGGVWLAALESLSEGRQVLPQIASVLGVREEAGRSLLQSLTDHLGRKRLLLVLDNCEHLLEATAAIVGHLLRECEGVRILATSREALGIIGETAWSVPCLALPDTDHLPQDSPTLLQTLIDYESVQLFVERAQAVQKSFALTTSNARTVAQVCSQLEGIPLAIELAAACVKSLTVEQIAARLHKEFGLLRGGDRTAQSRQQTLRATLDWSYDLLTEPERALLLRLSVFAGGWTLEAAEAVVADKESVAEGPPSSFLLRQFEVLDLLTSLVEKSLIVFEPREEKAGGRYRMLEMLRQYAAEKLAASGEAEQVARRHQGWYLALAEEAASQLQGAEQEQWLRRLDTEHENLRAVLAWCRGAEDGAEAGLRLAGALWRFWEVRGYPTEGRRYLVEALGRKEAAGRTPERAQALDGAGILAWRQGDYAAARTFYEESLAIQRELGNRGGIAWSLNQLGNLVHLQGDYAAARLLHQESLTLSLELQDKQGIANALDYLGNVAHEQADYAAARTFYEESLAIQRGLENKGGIAWSLNQLGNVTRGQGDFGSARSLYEESLAIQRELGDRWGIAWALYKLGNVMQDQGNYEAAKALYQESLAISRELGDRRGIAWSLASLGNVFLVQGDLAATRTLFEESLALYRELGDKGGIAYSLYCLGGLAYSQRDFDAARTLLQESLALYRETRNFFLIHALGALGHVEREVGDYARASALYQESLRLRREMRNVWFIVCSLEDFASLAGRQGQYERAVRLLGAAEALCATLGCPLPVGDASEYERTVAAAHTALSEEAFAAAWEEGRAMTLEQACAYVLDESVERDAGYKR
jgi:predicted ATPase/DNA-binding SARP family transcriptional activator